MLLKIFNQVNDAGVVTICLAAILLFGFLFTRLTKRIKLPNVTAYIFAGIVIGPYALNLIPARVIGGLDFVTDIALAFIAFGVGEYFKWSKLKKSGAQVLVITVLEALTAAAAITLAMVFIFKLPPAFSLLLGAIGCATAPASTIMTIRQYRAKGPFVNMILQVVALDDAVSLIAFSVCAAVAGGMGQGGRMGAAGLLLPVAYNLLAVLLGASLGWGLYRFMGAGHSKDTRLVVVVTMLLFIAGVCSALAVSPLLACMALGAVYANLSKDKHLFKQVHRFTPPILTIFFVLSGMKLNVPALAVAGAAGVGYFLIRILGKYAGAYVGAAASGAGKAIRNFLGLALVPQAGVSIGLAALAQRMLPQQAGVLLSTIILSSAVLYEIVGPACAKASLYLSHSIPEAAGEGREPGPELPAPDVAPREAEEGQGKGEDARCLERAS